MVRVGLIARGEDRGLGIQTWEFARAMAPERTLLVDMGEYARGFGIHHDRYPDALVVRFDRGTLPEGQIREWLAGLDVVFTAETFYDWRICRWADEAGAATVCQLNPEFLRPLGEYAAVPTRWWAPTSWQLAELPAGTRVVPVPVADDRFPFAAPERDPDAPLRVLHSVGHRAHSDRNGTGVLLSSLNNMRAPMRLTLAGQDSRMPTTRTRPNIALEVRTGGVADYWRLYEDQDALVIPRRYGGLCLPVQEAMAAGLAVVMTDAEPQASTWPVTTVRSRLGPVIRLPGGRLRPANAEPRHLAAALETFARDPEALAAAQARSLEWAEAHRWSVMRPLYEAELADACR